MATIDGIGLAEPSTITKSLAAVPVTRNSSVTYQEVMVLGSPNSTSLLALAEVTGAAPASTTVGLVVREVDRNVYQSTAADLQMTATPVAGSTWRTQPGSTLWASSAGFHFDSSGALQITGATSSTQVSVARTVGNSSAADFMPVRLVDSSGTGFLTPGNEYADGSTYSTKTGPALTYDNGSNQTMRMVAVTAPLPVQLRDSSGVGIVGSTGPIAVGANAVAVREVVPTIQSTTVQITSTHSTAVYSLISSAAALRHKVFAYIVQSTHTVPSTLVFMSSLAIDRWPVMFGSGSSGVTGANLAVSPPGWIFHADAANALNVRVEGGSSAASTVVVRIGLSWFDEA